MQQYKRFIRSVIVSILMVSLVLISVLPVVHGAKTTEELEQEIEALEGKSEEIEAEREALEEEIEANRDQTLSVAEHGLSV